MSSKKKEKKEWCFCSSCDTHLQRINFEAHQEFCKTEQSIGLQSTDSGDKVDSFSPMRVPFVREGHLMATFSKSNEKGVDMSKSKSLSLKASYGQTLSITKLKSVAISSTSLTLSLSSAIPNTMDHVVSSSIHSSLSHCPISPGDVFCIELDGQNLSAMVEQISGDFGVKMRSTDKYNSNTIDIMASFNDLTISSQNADALKPLSPLSYSTHFDEPKEESFLYYLAQHTHIVMQSKQSPLFNDGKLTSYRDIGGMHKQIKLMKELIELPLANPGIFTLLGVKPTKCILLYGPSGTGKSLLAKAAVDEAGLAVHAIGISSATSRLVEDIHQLLSQIHLTSSCAIFIDDIDLLAPSSRDTGYFDQSATSSLLNLIDKVKLLSNVFIIATSKTPDAIDISVRRRFSCDIEIPVPNVADRVDILCKLIRNLKCTINDEEKKSIGYLSHGFVGADLVALCREATRSAIHRASEILSQANTTIEEEPSISYTDFKSALQCCRPSALSSVLVDVPKVKWEDVGGQESVKNRLKEIVEWPMKHPEAFSRLGVNPPSGVLLYGPPGCSKTMLAKAVATESGFNFIAVKGPDLFDKYLGESEKALREIFRKARLASPSVVFIDEMDALGMKRGDGDSGGGSADVSDRILAQLLTEMDGVEEQQDVIFIAATNRPDLIDSALLRPGRIDRLLYIPLPDRETRKAIFEIQFRKIPVDSSVDLAGLADQTEWYSGAELCGVCREAAIFALQEDIDACVVCERHFRMALEQLKPRTDLESIEYFRKFTLSHQTR